jgi:asparagine synthase (glutamine-hydrolysing)
MCEISGVLAFKSSNFEVTAEYLARMRDTMVHRGPDGAGSWISPDRRVGLAHRRFSIIDLSDAASQPMSNGEGSLQIVFNGEIYNHAEIRRELEENGHRRWKTDHSDTEVILRSFEEWGVACLQKFREHSVGTRAPRRVGLHGNPRAGYSTALSCRRPNRMAHTSVNHSLATS